MSIFAIGDVHGCVDTLEHAVAEIGFRPSRDEIFMTGDLINRGPRSLDALRWARHHEASVTAVLGNHDLHLIAVHEGIRSPKRGDTFDEIFGSAEGRELISWLRDRPLMARASTRMLVHAGIHPTWTVDTATSLARCVETRLRDDPGDLLRHAYSNETLTMTAPLDTEQTVDLARALRTFVTIRICHGETGRLPDDFSGSPDEVPSGFAPWFDMRPGTPEPPYLFGHWAALGYRRLAGATCLDSGCVWGGSLTVLDVESEEVLQIPRRDP